MGNTDRLSRSVEKLLKVARLKADEINASLAAIRVARNSTETALAQLDHGLLEEQCRLEKMRVNHATADLERSLNAYTDKVRIKRANMHATLAQLAEREEGLKDDLVEAFAEIKKMEHLVAISEKNSQKTKQKRSFAYQDEMIAARYGR